MPGSGRRRSDAGRGLVVHWGQSGGGTRFHLELARELTRRGGWALSYNATSDQAAAMDGLGTEPMVVRTYRTRAGVVLGVPRLLVNALRLRRYLRRHGITRVVSSMESLYQSLVIPWILPKTVSYTVVVHDARQHPGDEHLLKRIGRRFELRRADRVVTLSESVTRDLVADGMAPTCVATLFHPVFGEAASAARCLPPAAPVVGVFGRLLPYKGIDLFLEAVGLLAARGVAIRGLVVGSGPEARLRTSESGQLVEWRDEWVPEDEVEKVIDSFDVLAVTYREASQSGVIAHAMTRAVPVVATPVGGLTEQVHQGQAGIVAADVTAEAVADAIAGLVKDGAAYAGVSRRALAAADRWSWSRFGDGLERAIAGG